MDYGIVSGYGAGGAAEGLQELLKQRLLEAQLAETTRHNQATEANAAQQIQETAAWRKIQQDALAEDRATKAASNLKGTIPMGAKLDDTQDRILTAGGEGSNIQRNPELAGNQFFDPSMSPPDVVPGQEPGRYWLGDAKQREAKAAQDRIAGFIKTLPDDDPRRQWLEMREVVGGNVPEGLVKTEQQKENPGVVHDTSRGLVRITPDNQIIPLGVQGYHPPSQSANNQANTRMDRSYQYNQTRLDKVSKPYEDQQLRMGRLTESLNQATPQADALVAPELLSVMAGGSGSGLRMNEAEISRIVGGRSNWENLKATLQKWSTDPAHANSITPDQRQQIRDLIGAVNTKAQKALGAIGDANDALIAASDENGHRKVLADLKRKLDLINGADLAGTGGVAPAATGVTIKSITPVKDE